MAWPKDVEAILSRGLSLHESGVNNWALKKDEVFAALEEFERIGIPVLGGDVYELDHGKPISNYDNWYCDPNTGEARHSFVQRSIDRARKYINAYRNPRGRETLFVLVAGWPHANSK